MGAARELGAEHARRPLLGLTLVRVIPPAGQIPRRRTLKQICPVLRCVPFNKVRRVGEERRRGAEAGARHVGQGCGLGAERTRNVGSERLECPTPVRDRVLFFGAQLG